MAVRFANLREEQEHQLEDKLRFLNERLEATNERISQLVYQRGRLELRMRHVARELHGLRAAEVKRAHDKLERTV